MTRAAEINADAWSRRRLLTVLVSGIAAALALMLGLGLALYYAVQPADATEGQIVAPVNPDAPAAQARGEENRDRIAAAPMLEVTPEDAAEGEPAATPAPTISVPAATRTGPVEIATGYPRTPSGAVGQLAAIVTSTLQGMSIQHLTAVHDKWAAPGAPTVRQWKMTKNVQAFLTSSGQQGQSKAPTVAVTATPVAGQVKGTDGPGWVVACVLVDVTAVVATQARIAYGHCERMEWVEGRWMIAPGPEAATAPSTWPGTDLAHEAGWRTWAQDRGTD